jgi:hypothetical protein
LELLKKNDMSFIKTTKERLRSKTPEYFKVIRKWALYVVAACTAVLALQATPYINLPTTLWRVVSYVLFAAGAIAAFCLLPTSDNDLSKK